MSKRSNWGYNTFRTGNLRYQILTGDINWEDYGATWFRQTRADGPHTYQVVRFGNMEDACGADWTRGHDSPYLASYTIVDLEHDTSEDTIKEALRFCGLTLEGNRKSDKGKLQIVNDGTGDVVADTPRHIDLVILEAVISYGVDWEQVSGRKGETARQLRARCAGRGY